MAAGDKLSENKIDETFSVSIAIYNLEDPDIFEEPDLRVQGFINGQRFCLPVENVLPLMSEIQKAQLRIMIDKLRAWRTSNESLRLDRLNILMEHISAETILREAYA